jgi:hypothetical protein
MTGTTHLTSAEELFNLPDDGQRHELIKRDLLTDGLRIPVLEIFAD